MKDEFKIIGGGVTGLAVAFLLANSFPHKVIKIYSKEVGGSYNLGGLKYLGYSKNTINFIDQLNKYYTKYGGSSLDYSVLPVQGGVVESENVSDIRFYPIDYFRKNEYQKIIDMQRQYYEKTRLKRFLGSDDLLTNMNNPFGELNHYKIECSFNLVGALESVLADMPNVKFYTMEFDSTTIRKFLEFNKEHTLIYTLPYNLIDPGDKTEYTNIKIYSGELSDDNNFDKVPHDYLYFPYLKSSYFESYKFVNRVSFSGIKFYIEETDRGHSFSLNSSTDIWDDLYNLINSVFNNMFFSDNVRLYIDNNPKVVLGHVVGKGNARHDFSDIYDLIKDVYFIGRYATKNPRMKLMDVIKDVYSFINNGEFK